MGCASEWKIRWEWESRRNGNRWEWEWDGNRNETPGNNKQGEWE